MIPTGNGLWSLAITDFDHDGRLDVVTPNVGSNSISVLMGTGSGLGPTTTLPTALNPNSVAAPDVNGDGDPDIVETGYSNLVLVRLQGVYEPPPPPPPPPPGAADNTWHEVPPLGKLAYHAGVYDSKRQCLWLFGGRRKDSGDRNEVWAYDLAGGYVVSRELFVSGIKPSPRAGHVMMLDPVRDRLIVFGGANTNDVWALNLADPPAWEQLLPTGTPPSLRSGAVAGYDSLRNRMVLFGGNDATGTSLDDTWALSLGPSPAWTPIVPISPLPPARAGTGVYDPIGDRLLIVGGVQGSYPLSQELTDVWALSLSAPTWTQLSTSGIKGGGAVVVMDPVRNRLVRYGGSTIPCPPPNPLQTFTLTPPYSWSTIDPAGRYGHVAVYDPVQDRLLVHGGVETCPNNHMLQFEGLSAYSFGVGTWSDLGPPVTRPEIRVRPLMVYVPSRQEAVVVGGQHDGFGALTDVWRLDLSASLTWQPLFTAGPVPFGFVGSSAVYDSLRDRVVFFGGSSDGRGSATLFGLTLGPYPSWVPLSPGGTPPPARSSHTAIYDPTGDRMLVFGGSTTGSDGGFIYDDLWQLTLGSSMAWSQISPPGPRPGARYLHGAIFDPLNQRMIVTGGRVASGTTSETWALSLSTLTWTQLAPTGIPPITYNDIPPVYDSHRERLVYFDGAGSTFELSLWGAPNWTLLPFTSSPSNRSRAATIYDTAGDRMLAYAGLGSAEYFTCTFCSPLSAKGDLWTLAFPPSLVSVDPGLETTKALALRAFPNPSRAVTTLEFDVPSKRAGTVRVFDVAGRMVRELQNGLLTVGRHQVLWDGRDGAGNRVTPGLYFVRARLGDLEQRRTIVRVR